MSRHASWRFAKALEALDNGGVIAYPTEAVWGLGCNPFDRHAVMRVLAIKQRSVAKGLILVVSQARQLGSLLDALDAPARSRLLAPTPMPTSWLVPHHGLVPDWVTGIHSTVAVRISSHPVVAGLCDRYGQPLVSTSANPAAANPARTELKARCYFGQQVDVYVSGTTGKAARPSQIRDLMSGEILR